MPRYRVRMPAKGEIVRSWDGDEFAIADTPEEAFRILVSEGADPRDLAYLSPRILSGWVAYKRHVDSEMFEEDVEPGDTVYSFLDDDGRELGENELRVWEKGIPHPHWSIVPVQDEQGCWIGQWKAEFDGKELTGTFATSESARLALESCQEKFERRWKGQHRPLYEDLTLWPAECLAEEQEEDR